MRIATGEREKKEESSDSPPGQVVYTKRHRTVQYGSTSRKSCNVRIIKDMPELEASL